MTRLHAACLGTWLALTVLAAPAPLQAQAPASPKPHVIAPRLAPPQALSRDAVTLRQFVKGTLRFVILHELGHGLIDVYELPVLGREEDAADRFAIFWLSPDGAGEDGVDAIAAMEWWLASARLSGASRQQLPWWGEHGIDEQRGYQIACLLYGASPEDFGPLAGRVGIPDARRQGCQVEAYKNNRAWAGLLRPRVSRLKNLDGFMAPMSFETPTADNELAGRIVGEMKVLEEVQLIISQFASTDGSRTITIRARNCGVSNAFWNPGKDELTLCYELVNEIAMVGWNAGFR